MTARGLSLRALCREAGLDPSFFSKVLAGKRSPPSEESALRRLAKALELDSAEVIVSAGRIPEEWGALWKDPAVFREVRRLVGARPVRPAPLPPARVAAAPRPGGLAEELL